MELAILVVAIAAVANAASLGASPNRLSQSGEIVSVEWSGLESPSALDWIGIYTPPDSPDENFIGYVLLSSSPGWRSGKGSIELPLVNMRSAYHLRLFRGIAPLANSSVDEDGNPLPSTDRPAIASLEIQFESYNEPTQIHLALTSSPGEVRVMFVTRDDLPCYVLYGTEEHSLDLTAATKSVTYHRDEMCDKPANSSRGWREPGFIHDGVVGKLKPGKRYFYQVGSKEGGWSKTHSFVSPPEQGDETNALLFGDMGTSAPYKTFLWTQLASEKTLRWLQRDVDTLGDTPTFLSHIGDISYARGYAWLWDEFFHRIQPVAARAPYTVCIGNHEYDWPQQPWKPDWAERVYGTDGGGECGVPYSLKFQMPGNSSLETGTKAPATKNLYFSIDFGVVHFLYFSTETDFLPGSEQYEFIVRDLESVDREKLPYVVVLGHRPMYTSNLEVKDTPVRARMLEHLEPVLMKNRVDLALWGHVHKYERTCPIQNFSCDGANAAPIHVVIGMGGQDWQPKWSPRDDHPEYPIFPQPEWSVFRSEEFGYVRLHATKKMLRLTYVGVGDGEAHDYVEIPASSRSATRVSASSEERENVVSSRRSGGTSYFVTSVLWFGCGSLVAVILSRAWKLRSDARGEWKPLEMKPLPL